MGLTGTTDGFERAPLYEHVDKVPNEYIVVVKERDPHAIPGLAVSMAASYGGTTLNFYETVLKGFLVRIEDSSDLERLLRDPRVEYVEENVILQVPSISGSQTATGNLWYLDRIDERFASSMDNEYAYCTEGDFVYVYLIDVPVDATHPEFDFTTVENKDFLNVLEQGAENGCESKSGGWHGTAVASLIAGKTNGVAKSARIVSLGTHNCFGTSPMDRVISALNWIVSDGTTIWTDRMAFAYRSWEINPHLADPAVINWSGWATPGESHYAVPQTIEQAIHGVAAEGAVIVSSADNYQWDSCEFAPNNLAFKKVPNVWGTGEITIGDVIVVGGTELVGTEDHRWQDSPVPGQDTGSNSGQCISIWAPAANIDSARHHGHSGGLYGSASGTSFSAPIVSGVVARYIRWFKVTYGYAPSPTQVYEWLDSNSTKYDSSAQPLVKSTATPSGTFINPHTQQSEFQTSVDTDRVIGMVHWAEGVCKRQRTVQ